MEKEKLIPELLELFRQHGYDGVSIAHISKATGLGKSSLYHHFPEGKEQMANEVLQFIGGALKENFIAPLRGEATPREKITAMSRVAEKFYQCGKKGCLIDALTLGDANGLFREKISRAVDSWIDAIADVAVEAGLTRRLARERAENALVAIQGGLVLSRALNDYQLFKRVVKGLPSLILD